MIDIEKFADAARWESLPDTIDKEVYKETHTDKDFPGAILPAIATNQQVFWYGIAENEIQWRTLSSLLNAYAGPTVTTFSNKPMELNSERAPDKVLLDGNVHQVAL